MTSALGMYADGLLGASKALTAVDEAAAGGGAAAGRAVPARGGVADGGVRAGGAASGGAIAGAHARDGGVTHKLARRSDGTVFSLPLLRYLGPADETDEQILRAIEGPVLDVGCGPGRHLHVLARRGVFALGVDLSAVAVELARGGGGHAIVGSIFDELPAAGTWRSALLLDGNIGIGGAPARLLARIATLLRDEGQVLVELDPPTARSASAQARLETAHARSRWFPWAWVAAPDIVAVASASGFRVADQWTTLVSGRWFARLTKEGGG